MRTSDVSERMACRVLGQHRSTQRKTPKRRADDAALTADVIALATEYGRYGCGRITAMLRAAGWAVNGKRVERIWRLEGLKAPRRQPKKSRLRLTDGSCVRLRPERPNHVWSYDVVEDRTHDGRTLRMLNVIDAFARERLAIRIDRKLKSTDVIGVLSDLFILRGVPGRVRSDHGPEFVAKAVREWRAAAGAKTAFIEPGSPWENGCCESFNGKLRDALPDGESLYSLAEARIIVEGWRRQHDTVRPHSSLGDRPPAPEAVLWPAPPSEAAPVVAAKPTMLQDRPRTTRWEQASPSSRGWRRAGTEGIERQASGRPSMISGGCDPGGANGASSGQPQARSP